MTQQIGATALILQLAIAIILALVAVLIARMKVIRELADVQAASIALVIHKVLVILRVHGEELLVATANQIPATNVRTIITTAILIIAGTAITATVDVAVGAAAIIVALVVVVVLLAVPAQVVAVVVVVAAVQLHRGDPANMNQNLTSVVTQ